MVTRGPFSVCVYCASGPVADEYLALAADLGTAIGARGWQLVSGGGNVSMMGAVAHAARAAGAHTLGVIPKALVHREVADVDADELVVTDTMRQRKQVMEDRADAFVALPGGIGTLEELFETWTAGCLGMHAKPVVLLDPVGHYTGLLDWLTSMPRGFVSQRSLDALVVTTTVDGALGACAGGGKAADSECDDRCYSEVRCSDS
ncbi:TIGR00730 family Rossman fold protein [Rhodococcus sp. HNM0569]|uniref:LOG family protein n=1 Tax=Rhodococcus sp. HNM0569 TaxID=2716340 RepID=UPI00146B37E3|nr:TIGR00730 family Rossman fold protein [Rhodococcus sp. HNM0569]NLU83865.1 TIGR00730 family Rossman fold protein [Rhodococcus sp. HNM0569]